MEYQYLTRIDSPADLKKLPREALPQVAAELRDYLISVVSKVGGHLASSLGAVELTLALHYTFDAPRDKIVWDVGHQAYGHKILTGRRDRFPTLRQYGGISGFPVRAESPYDTFNVAHACTAISGALGMAVARDLKGENFHVIAVVGDAGLTGGVALEGINNLGTLQKKVLVILNDNEMSISPNVGAIAGYLNRIVHGQSYHRLTHEAEKMILSVPRIGPRLLRISRDLLDSAKTLLIPGMVFEELGFEYVGPVNGHSIDELLDVLAKVKDNPGPTLLHVVTQKGKGYPHAEKLPMKYHGVRSSTSRRAPSKRLRPRRPAIPRSSGRQFVSLRRRTLASSRLLRRCVRERGWMSFPRNSPSGFSTSGSRNNTPWTLRQALPVRVCGPWRRSIPLSFSVRTTNWRTISA